MPESPSNSSTGWARARRWFRRLRLCAWALAFGLVLALVLLHSWGLPGPLQDVILAELRARGLDLQAERIRLRGISGIVADRVRFAETGSQMLGDFRAEEVDVRGRLSALMRGRFEIDSLHLRQGRLRLRVNETNEPLHEIEVTNAQAVLRFPATNRWEIDRFEASSHGARVLLTATLTNVPSLTRGAGSRPDSSPRGRRQPLLTAAARERLQHLSNTLREMQFAESPEIRLMVQGDAFDPRATQARLHLNARQAATRWGAVEALVLAIDWGRAMDESGSRRSMVRVEFDQAQHERGRVVAARFQAEGITRPGQLWPDEMTWSAACGAVTSRWVQAQQVKLRGASRLESPDSEWWHSRIELLPGPLETPWLKGAARALVLEGRHTLRRPLHCDATLNAQVRQATSKWATADNVEVSARVTHPGALAGGADRAEWDWWNDLRPADLMWTIRTEQIRAPDLAVQRLECSGSWRAPVLVVTNLHARLYQGELQVAGDLDVDSRAVRGEGVIHFDVHQLGPRLGPGGRKWLSQYAWEQPPVARGRVGFMLPPWTRRGLNWKADVEPSLTLSGDFSVQKGAFRGVPVDAASSRLLFTNRTWRLPDLRVTRPEGEVRLDYTCDNATQDYSWRIESSINPLALRPAAPEGAQRALDMATITLPPRIDGTLWGRWQAPERLGFKGSVAATNFSFRGEAVDRLSTELEWTNQWLQVRRLLFAAGSGAIEVPEADFDVAAELIHLRGAVSTADPGIVTRMIGPQTAAALEPYRFDKPPRVLVSGAIHVRDETRNDLRFELNGGPFRYWRFNLPEVGASLHWLGNSLTLSNLTAPFYGGHLNAGFAFDFTPASGADFSYQARVAGVDLRQFMSDMVSPTNKLEGILEGDLFITAANSADWASWQGHGRATLRDGFLWSIPMLGMLSEPLDSIIPGLAKTRFSSGAATFTVTNSVVHTADLTLHSPVMRLSYEGTVDFDANVNARVEAQVLRDTWLLGRFFGAALMPLTKLLEYKVTGTLGKPKTDLLHIPKVLLIPMQPLRMFRQLFNTEPDREPPPAPAAPAPAPAPASPKP